MDLGPDPVDHDELIQRYGRRLFVLAYHLTGLGSEAEELCRECLVRSLLSPDFPANEKEAGIYLHRGLVSLWKERAGLPGRGPGSVSGGHAALFRALSRLDPVSRAVFVLRVAEGLEYETIGKVLDMAPDIVYARLLQARGGLREGERALEASLFETMNLFLDGRLPPDRRGSFERRMQLDSGLRERVEFHRGLTLELHEEAPPLPREFVPRLRDQIEKARETLLLLDQATEAAGFDPVPRPPAAERIPSREPRRPPPWGLAAGALVLLAAGIGLGLWLSRRPVGARPMQERPAGAAAPAGTPDEATIEALRSLGYLAPGKEKPKEVAGGRRTQAQERTPRPAATPRIAAPKPTPAAPRPTPAKPAPTPSASGPTPAPPTPTPAPAEAPTPAASPAPSPSDTQGQGADLAWRVAATPRPPDAGTGHRVIRTAAEWTALFEGSGTPPPEVDFEQDMVVQIAGGLVVKAVRNVGDALLIECRGAPVAAGAGSPPDGATGLAVVLPISSLPVRVVVR